MNHVADKKMARVPNDLIPFLDAIAEMLARQTMAEQFNGRDGLHGKETHCQSHEEECKAIMAIGDKEHVTL